MASSFSLQDFHPAVGAWFASRFAAPTPAQRDAWPAIAAGRHTLIAAPTGSGKTLAAFLAAIDGLVREGVAAGGLPDATRVVYVSPLKALSNDIAINLEAPLAGIREELAARGLADLEIRSAVRTGDTPAADRQRMLKTPPHILVTTPESLYVLLGSDSGRLMLGDVRTVIVDEIHAIADDKRGSHLALTLERLEALCQRRLVRVGLSATQKPIEEVARFLVGAHQVDGAGRPDCVIVDSGHVRERDLAIEMPPLPLEAVMSNQAWELVYDRIADCVRSHRTTLVFANTRRLTERVTRHLGERLGHEHVAAHHGSLAKELRLRAEQRLKRGELKVLVATASLELGIDIGEVDLVCQLGSPHSIAAFLQRVGRSGHAVGATPKGRLFPLSRDDLVECAALLDSVRRGELDRLHVPEAPLDVLAQQIVAESACAEWDEGALYDWLRRAWPYRHLTRERFDAVVRMLAEGFTSRRGARAGYLHRDAVHGRIKGRRNARLTALTSGGTIPDTADYTVVLEPQATMVGTVHEDFAVESLAGDVFQLGNASYRILRVERGRVRVEDAHGQPPSIPFWVAEAPGRSDELSASVSRLRAELDRRLANGVEAARRWLIETLALDEAAAAAIVEYLARARQALGLLPTQQQLAMERFFDESGGTQLVIHSPYGSRINKAWGLALRKRFCRTFNFELQAAATEDAIVLSLSTSHSFALADVARYLHSATARDVLIQALLDAPLFGVRWRWAATTALALPRYAGGQRVAPQLQRMKSEDLLATVFPDQVACLENIVGERQIPDHPLVAQTLQDCLGEAMDADGWLDLLRGLESGAITMTARDLAEPSPLAAEILTARPYAFLDDAPLEERRTQAVQMRRWSDPETADDLGALDADAIAAVREEAWPGARDVDEMHEVLMDLGWIGGDEAASTPDWTGWLERLARDRRATRVHAGPGRVHWCAAERLPQLDAVFPAARREPAITAPPGYADAAWTAETALVDLLRARLTALGPARAADLAAALGVPVDAIEAALIALETEGYVLRGRFTPGTEHEEWCERHLLARIHRYTLKRLRREIEPVEPRDFMRFLFEWQRVAPAARASGPEALQGIVNQLEGYQAAAGAWETDLLPARLGDYTIGWLDELCRSGRVVWARVADAAAAGRSRAAGPLRSTPIVIVPRRSLALWTGLGAQAGEAGPVSSRAQAVLDLLDREGALFFDELVHGTRLLRTELEDVLGELVSRGLVHADSFAGLRALLMPASKRSSHRTRRIRHGALLGIEDAGRWVPLRGTRRTPDAGARDAGRAPAAADEDTLEHVVRVLLRRYGVLTWQLLSREADWMPRWRELVRVCRRLEARGEIRGGRFIAGLSGEQFALPEAIAVLRAVRRRPADGGLVVVAATDPLNLAGIVTPGTRIGASVGSRVLYEGGVPLATLVAGAIGRIDGGDPTRPLPAEWREALIRGTRAAAGATGTVDQAR
ncbi:MAG TPA: DEAD/DEAH box helicase [Dokdonella sp.]|uniref:DEAD/DEAH box helicase n=1 Tax=Dokdonella sp. TaxID=2291710 RepID=UPI002C964C1A|nr:DEAD/DEAH box helicase [Dokdonella sp.]HUD43716.1 DEAD/DEAH box helicase [Dokdonella sp.]